jgi:putative ABC transport system permease protein
MDLSLVRRTIGDIIAKVSVAVRFLALFSLAMAIPVLFSAVAATRRDRLREGVLLKTLGATRRQIGRILLSEYALLGALGALTGMALSFLGAWGLVHFVFDGTFAPALLPAAMIAVAMMALAIAIGLLTSRDVFRETPMAALRDS